MMKKIATHFPLLVIIFVIIFLRLLNLDAKGLNYEELGTVHEILSRYAEKIYEKEYYGTQVEYWRIKKP